jgi:hypothetical protein
MLSPNRICRRKVKSGLFLWAVFSLALSASGVIRFTEVSAIFLVKGYNYFGGQGAAWVDVNRDGRLDLYVKNAQAKGIPAVNDILFINYSAYFFDEAVARGVADGYAYGTHGAVFADIDSDKDFDLFATTTYLGISPAHNHIYRNAGNGFFQDITSSISPPQTINVSPRGVAAADFDKDGDLDFYFSNALPNPFLSYPIDPQAVFNFYVNNGVGTFTSMYRGVNWSGFTQGVSAVDIDNDGDIDLAEAKWDPPSTIYLNDGFGNFRDAGEEWGLPQTSFIEDNGMTFADVDNDGDLDLAVVGSQKVVLYKNQNKSFSRYQTVNSSRTHSGFHAAFGDFDHDGDLDMYLSGERVYENNGTGLFTAVSVANSGLSASLSSLDPRGCALGDFDGDGDLDIYVTDRDSFNLLFRNEINNSDWLQVEITGDHLGAIGGIGTKLDLYAAGHLNEPAYLKGHREIQGEYGYLGQDMPIAHFGAPSAGGAKYDLKVTFLNGRQKTLRNLSPGQKIEVSSISPPLNFLGKKVENKALFYRETLIELSWEPNPQNTGVAKYRLYQVDSGQTLIAEVPAGQYSYTLRNIDKSRTYVFTITAVDEADNESESAGITVSGGPAKEITRRQGLGRGQKGVT